MNLSTNARARRIRTTISTISLSASQIAAAAQSETLTASKATDALRYGVAAVALIGVNLVGYAATVAPEGQCTVTAVLLTMVVAGIMAIMMIVDGRLREMQRETEASPLYRARLRHADAVKKIHVFNAAVLQHQHADIKNTVTLSALASERPALLSLLEDAEDAVKDWSRRMNASRLIAAPLPTYVPCRFRA